MSVVQSLATFLATASLLTLTPGLDTAMILRTAASSGTRRRLRHTPVAEEVEDIMRTPKKL